MEDRKRNILAVIIAFAVVLALVYSFGLNIFRRMPEFHLADPSATASEPGISEPGGASGVEVELTPATVQSVIASLSKYSSYTRTLSVTYRWGADSAGTLTARVWADGGWVRTQAELPTGLTECSIVGEGTIWIWYTGSRELAGRVRTAAAQTGAQDLAQRIPTYEDVLELDPAEIVAAEYVRWQEQPCIYVETGPDALGQIRRFWVSESSGLLLAAQTEQDGLVVYEMTSAAVTSPLTAGEQIFLLPDGTELHAVS